MMPILQIEQTKCIQCGACAAVCPIAAITIGESGPKEEANIEFCIHCGHCVAVCPNAALDNQESTLKNQVKIQKELSWDAEQASQFLRSRRSIRNYRPEQVPKEKLLQLLDVARFAPTGGNSQGISFRVISGQENLHKLTAATLDWLRQEAGFGNTDRFIQAFNEGKDPILRNAPHLIVALCCREFAEIGRSNAAFSLAYAELFAPTIGLGTCWAGFLQHCAFSGYAPLLGALNLPADLTVAGALMVGYPLFRYHRLVDRNPLKVSWNE
ncbi:MAG TPA: ferredoxin [Firmicutes bacterium]|nr:ferredoxin [Bacillota bacterium]